MTFTHVTWMQIPYEVLQHIPPSNNGQLAWLLIKRCLFDSSRWSYMGVRQWTDCYVWNIVDVRSIRTTHTGNSLWWCWYKGYYFALWKRKCEFNSHTSPLLASRITEITLYSEYKYPGSIPGRLAMSGSLNGMTWHFECHFGSSTLSPLALYPHRSTDRTIAF